MPHVPLRWYFQRGSVTSGAGGATAGTSLQSWGWGTVVAEVSSLGWCFSQELDV